ncbi:hypothetical protein SAMN05216228_100687 [Rhizobium tibeticum]|uniref:Phenylacetic acid degradation protein paaN n=1 Tax=Rhizobium tibeticum TaxID=501024 RepID=A0A1H8IDE1_9HYPH|nr:hypothetical protein [Rhizobium tibeticum]SEH70433.1 phenylacetic acid degradation protein paaN [Rhizobium tibeticum]SEN66222.1 hypothetical protein SAMN05216228_100687 [Rhizobium tibeticum]
MHTLFARHEPTLAAALKAAQERAYWSAYPEVPSGKIYGETATDDGLSSYNARLGTPFDLPGHPATVTVGTEVSPFGPPLGITYPAVDAITLIEASRAAAPAWAAASAETRVGICLEILARLNRISFEMANAVMHTTGQAFAMALLGGAPDCR